MKENYTIRMEFIQYKLIVYNTNKKNYTIRMKITNYRLQIEL